MLTALVVFGGLLAFALVGLTISNRESNRMEDRLRPRTFPGTQGEYDAQSHARMRQAGVTAPDDRRAAKNIVPPIPS